MSRYSATISAVHSWRDPDAARLYSTEDYYSVSLVDDEGNEITCIGGNESLAAAWEIATEAADEHCVEAVEFADTCDTEKVTDRYTPEEDDEEEDDEE
ncbi:MAG: hypothetical protein ACTS8S_06285, partial [Giesbergeria sp.]